MTGWIFAPLMASAQAQADVTSRFDIAAQPLGSALTQFADRAGMRLIFASQLTAGRISAGVSGSLTHEAALERLLEGTGLGFRFSGVNTVTIIDPAAEASAGVAADGSTMLDAIDVTAGADRTAKSGRGFQGTPDWVYETPEAVSVVSTDSLDANPARHGNDLLDDVSGTYTADNPQDPGINVNVRGLQDQARVNTMIDGVRQNFQLSGHGSTGYTYLDPAMIRAVEVEKTVAAGAGGAATLGGQVDFRTVTADDLLDPGDSIGGEVEGTTGTNAYEFSGSILAAARASDTLSFVGGVSHKKLGDYDIGHNGEIAGYFGPVTEPADYTGSDIWSGLFKAEIVPDDEQSLVLSWLGFQGDYATGTGQYIDTNTTTNHTLRTGYEYDPLSPFVDLKANLWYNDTHVSQYRPARTNYGAFDVDYRMRSVGVTLENTSDFQLADRMLSVNYGLEAFRDDTTSASAGSDPTDDPDGAWFAGAMPEGTRSVASLFSSADYAVTDWLSVGAGLRYDAYDLSATALMWDGTTSSYYEENVASSGGRLLPSASVTISPTGWLDVFASYSEGYRPPAIMENAASGTHIGSAGQFYAPNPDLEAEHSTTWEVGANLRLDDLLAPGDSLRMKLAGFDRRVENYISLAVVTPNPLVYTNINAANDSRFKGVELEANYESDRFFVGGSYSYLDADLDTSYTYHYVVIPGVIEGDAESEGGLFIYVPPKHKATAQAGMRFLDERLTLGGRVTYSGPSVYRGSAGHQSDIDGFTVYDIFGSYDFNETATLNFAVSNITDVAYADTLGNPNFGAPGRTATMSLKVRF
ncbi:TonB-dependent receptor [Oricola sp.]|uniref:TonB-dependent receptor n=1 Tax=Oricola sp. TaxID=1979950 RepID=UPI0025DD078F|nr:TonB-dependent receptor [Oricola sp.]MCI5074039.1 TonB-dependent hemoglobin/transferrin/lactoferrin family receptor [Oricola sp.]